MASHDNRDSTSSILLRSVAEYVSFGLGQPVRRHLHGDALSDPADFPHADLEGQRQRGRPDRRRRRGDAEHRPGLFRRTVGQAAKAKARGARGLLPGRDWQAAHGRRYGLARRPGWTVPGPAGRRHPLRPARCSHRLFGGRGQPRKGLRARRRRRQRGCVPGPAARCLAAHRVAARHSPDLLSSRSFPACSPS